MPGDENIFNSMGYRAVVPQLGTLWSFPFADLALTTGSVVDRWVDPATPQPGSSNTTITSVSGDSELNLKVAVKTSPLDSGLYHYEIALMNFDFDPQISSFSLPLAAGVEVRNLWFGDGGRS